MNSSAEDFPTPVSPTRMIVYDVSALAFDVMMTPCLRSSTLLEMRSVLKHPRGRCNLLDGGGVTLITVFQGVLAWASQMKFGSDLVTTRDRCQ